MSGFASSASRLVQIDLEPRAGRIAGEKAQVGGRGRAVLRMGIAFGEIARLRRVEHRELLLRRRLRHRGQHLVHRLFEQHAVQPSGVVAQHQSARRRLACIRQPRRGEGRAVRDEPVERDVQHDDLVIGRYRVELGAGDMAPLFQRFVIILPHDDPAALRDGAPRDEIADHALQAGDVGDGRQRLVPQVEPARHLERDGEMRMGIDEARQHCRAGKIVDQGILAGGPARALFIADENYLAVAGDDCLGQMRRVAVHRDNRSAAIDGRAILCAGRLCGQRGKKG